MSESEGSGGTGLRSARSVLPGETNGSRGHPGSFDGERRRDKWDYIEILARPISAFLTALTIALIGWFGQQVLSERERQETRRAAQTQDYRLFTELVSKREDAESSLRKDMFKTILGEFFRTSETEDSKTNIARRLLKLEMLALNFGESLSLTPLFLELDNDIDARLEQSDDELGSLDRDADRSRLHSLARRVSGRQLSALAPGGTIFEFDVPLSAASDGKTFRWPDDAIPAEFGSQEFDQLKADLADIDLDRIKRTYTATFTKADTEYKTVEVALEIQTWDKKNEHATPKTTEMQFELNYFNFPMVDNTRLSEDQRFALIMEIFGDKSIRIVGICFRGMYSSQRDKPFLDDVIHRLNRNAALRGDLQ